MTFLTCFIPFCGCSSSVFQSHEFYGLLRTLCRARKNNWKCTSAQSSSSPSPDPSLPFQTRTSSRATFGLYFEPKFAVAALKEPSPLLSLSASFQTLPAATNSSSFSTSSTSFSSLEKKKKKTKIFSTRTKGPKSSPFFYLLLTYLFLLFMW